MGKTIKQTKNTKKAQKSKLMPKSKGIKKDKKDAEVSRKNKRTAFEPIQDYSVFMKAQLKLQAQAIKKLEKKIVLDEKQLKSTIKAVLKLHEMQKSKNDLLDVGEDFIYMEIVMSKVPQNYSIRPKAIKLTHPIYSKEYNSQFALIVRDPAKDFKKKIEDMAIPTIAEVLDFKQLENYPTYKDKRELFASFDLFFVDYKIYSRIQKQTGQIFYQRKKIPFAFDIEKVPEYHSSESYEDYLNDFSKSTYFIMGNGPQYTLKIGRVSQSVKNIAENVLSSVHQTLSYLTIKPATFKSVRQITLKTAKGMSLPIYSSLSKKEMQAYQN